MGVTAMSTSESKYFKRFGLQPPVEKSGAALSLNGGEPASPGGTPHEVRSLVFFLSSSLFHCRLKFVRRQRRYYHQRQ